MKGFTLIEMVVVMAMGLVVLTTTTVLLLSGQKRVTKVSAVEQVLSELRTSQIKAMTGAGAQGVHFGTNAYTLFGGTSYNVADNSNFVVNLDNDVNLSTTFPGSDIVFLAVSGEINGFVSGLDTLSIDDTVIHFNKYGVPDRTIPN